MESLLPFLEPYQTAVFAPEKGKTKVRFYTIERLRRVVREDIRWLTEHGYCCFIVSCGNAYGRLVLTELMQKRMEGSVFQLFTVEVCGEEVDRNSLRRLMCPVQEKDRSFFGYSPMGFVQDVLRQVSVICTENGRKLSCREVPADMLVYYEELQNMQ